MPGSAQEKAAAAPTEDQAFCKKCGAGGSVNIVPNWHDRASHAVPFTKHWKT